MTEAHFICLPELSERTGLPQAWLRRAADAGEIPSLRVGRRRMFLLKDVLGVIASGTTKRSGTPTGGRRVQP
jgi:hypothetical protein